MYKWLNGVVIAVSFVFSTETNAQPDDVYVSGILHQPLGGVTTFSAARRRLSACCIGSSGKDGVEVRVVSAYGGNVGVEVGTLLGTAGASVRHRPKGWDGLIYGTHQLDSHGDGTGTFTFDFTELGATDVHVAEYAANGALTGEETVAGPVVSREWIPDFTCPGGGTPVLVQGWRRVCSSCPWFWWVGWICDDGGVFTAEQARIVLTPTLMGGTPSPAGADAILVTAADMTELAVRDTSIAPYGVQTWGTGTAHISEQCLSGACTPEEQTLVVDNLGSSGEDGVAIDIGPSAGGISATIGRGRCCRGHVIIMKAFDDEGQEQRVSSTQVDELNPIEELGVDFSSLGAGGYRLTLFDGGGGVLGPPSGTEILGGTPNVQYTNPCGGGLFETWTNDSAGTTPVWTIEGCGLGYDFVLPGPVNVSGVQSFRIEPVGATSGAGRLLQATITSDDVEDGFVIGGISVISGLGFAIPAMSTWGAMIMALAVATAGALLFARRRRTGEELSGTP